MNVLMMCPAKVATGGTESIHKFAHELNKVKGMNVKILYVGPNLNYPQPPEYAEYNIDYTILFPDNYTGVLIFPEIWGNKVLEERYKNCIRVINWGGFDVYSWHTPLHERWLFMRDKSVLHLVQSEYAGYSLKKRGVPENRILQLNDVLNDKFFEDYEEQTRCDTILYNPAKATEFQNMFIRGAKNYGLTFRPIEGLSRVELIQLLRTTKLYIDFGVFSGRERIPREAAMCGCCVITSNTGAAAFYNDVAIPDKYKFELDPCNVDKIRNLVCEILEDYEGHKHDFDCYRESIINNLDSLEEQCKIIADRLLERENENSGT